MATTPDSSKKIKFAITALAPLTPLAISLKVGSNFDIKSALPTAQELTALNTPDTTVAFIKSRLLLLTNLLSASVKTPPYKDITSATQHHTVTLTTSLAKATHYDVRTPSSACMQQSLDWRNLPREKVIDMDDPMQVKVRACQTTASATTTFASALVI
jgi:hypothetical protein